MSIPILMEISSTTTTPTSLGYPNSLHSSTVVFPSSLDRDISPSTTTTSRRPFHTPKSTSLALPTAAFTSSLAQKSQPLHPSQITVIVIGTILTFPILVFILVLLKKRVAYSIEQRQQKKEMRKVNAQIRKVSLEYEIYP